MGFLDRAKEAAQRAKSGARVAREQGQQRIEDLQARRQAEVLLREVGLASYEENRGEGGHEAVVRAVAKLDEHARTYNIDLSTSGIRGYLRTATGAGEDGPRDARTADAQAPATGSEPTKQPDKAEQSAAPKAEPNAEQSRAASGPAADRSGDSDKAADASDAAGTTKKAASGGAQGPKKAAAKKTAAKKTGTAKKAAPTTSTTSKSPSAAEKPADGS